MVSKNKMRQGYFYKKEVKSNNPKTISKLAPQAQPEAD